MKKENKIQQILYNAKLAYRYIKDPDVSMLWKVMFVFPLIYIISPVDLVSDFAPFLGWLDDTVVALVVWKYLFTRLNGYGIKNNSDDESDYTLDDDEYEIR